jgi:hypothetical protein
MGDRANIFIVDQPVKEGEEVHGIYYYTHWSGEEWPERLRQALVAGKGRWGDDQYLNRIIASRIFSDIHDEETGGGISTVIGDNGHPIIVCNTAADTVSFAPEGSEANSETWYGTKTFEQYVAQDRATYPET